MMSQLSFCEIEEEKIDLQKTFLSNFNYLRKTGSKMISTSSTPQALLKYGEQSIFTYFNLIDRIYYVLQ